MVNEQRVLDTFLELVQIDSESKEEARICAHLKKTFEDLGCEVFEDDASSKTEHKGNNLIVTLPATKEGVDKIYFTSHMDTVFRVKASNQSSRMAMSRRTVRQFLGQMIKQDSHH